MSWAAPVAGLGAMALVGAFATPASGRIRRPTIARRRSTPTRRAGGRARGAHAAVVGVGVLVVAGPVAALALVTVVVVARWWHVHAARLRRASAIRTSYPDAIDLVVLAVRAGLLPPAALRATCPHLPTVLQPAFAEVAARTDRGERFADALTALTDELGVTARPMVDSLAAADRYGLPISPVLERLATEARADRRRVADATARQLPVRLAAPLVVCTLPSFVLLAIVPLLVGAFSSWRMP